MVTSSATDPMMLARHGEEPSTASEAEIGSELTHGVEKLWTRQTKGWQQSQAVSLIMIQEPSLA